MPIGNETARLQDLKSTIERGRTEVARAEATLESLQKQEAEIHGQLRELGVAPENLEAEIARLQAEVAEKLSKAEALLAPASTTASTASPPPAPQGA